MFSSVMALRSGFHRGHISVLCSSQVQQVVTISIKDLLVSALGSHGTGMQGATDALLQTAAAHTIRWEKSGSVAITNPSRIYYVLTNL